MDSGYIMDEWTAGIEFKGCWIVFLDPNRAPGAQTAWPQQFQGIDWEPHQELLADLTKTKIKVVEICVGIIKYYQTIFTVNLADCVIDWTFKVW